MPREQRAGTRAHSSHIPTRKFLRRANTHVSAVFTAAATQQQATSKRWCVLVEGHHDLIDVSLLSPTAIMISVAVTPELSSSCLSHLWPSDSTSTTKGSTRSVHPGCQREHAQVCWPASPPKHRYAAKSKGRRVMKAKTMVCVCPLDLYFFVVSTSRTSAGNRNSNSACTPPRRHKPRHADYVVSQEEVTSPSWRSRGRVRQLRETSRIYNGRKARVEPS